MLSSNCVSGPEHQLPGFNISDQCQPRQPVADGNGDSDPLLLPAVGLPLGDGRARDGFDSFGNCNGGPATLQGTHQAAVVSSVDGDLFDVRSALRLFRRIQTNLVPIAHNRS
jgi:hypothetical protein